MSSHKIHVFHCLDEFWCWRSDLIRLFCIIRIESMHLKCHVPEITFLAMNDNRQVFQSCHVIDTLAVDSLKKSSALSWYHMHFIRAILGASRFISWYHNLEHSQQKGVFKLSRFFHAFFKSSLISTLTVVILQQLFIKCYHHLPLKFKTILLEFMCSTFILWSLYLIWVNTYNREHNKLTD